MLLDLQEPQCLLEGHQATWDLVDPLEVVPQDHLVVVCMDLQEDTLVVHIQVLMDLVVLQEAKEVLYPLVEVQQHKEQLLQVQALAAQLLLHLHLETSHQHPLHLQAPDLHQPVHLHLHIPLPALKTLH